LSPLLQQQQAEEQEGVGSLERVTCPPIKQRAAVCAGQELVAPNTSEHSNSYTCGAEAVEEKTRPRTPLEVRILRTSMVSYLLSL
jgi:hypothetical protein